MTPFTSSSRWRVEMGHLFCVLEVHRRVTKSIENSLFVTTVNHVSYDGLYALPQATNTVLYPNDGLTKRRDCKS